MGRARHRFKQERLEGRIVRHRIEQWVAAKVELEVQVGSRPVIRKEPQRFPGIAETDVALGKVGDRVDLERLVGFRE
jgi:hypothetical protein